ncbi:MAG TPA: hypothetical protein VKW06_21545 [Candidatus Angelobacter sp.]|nr:hypothetical protein [Candidatus Angelobacter sp.]
MSAKHWNWRLWAGFVAVLVALLSYLSLFMNTRAVFWPSLAMAIAGVLLLISGLGRAFGNPQIYRGKIAGPVLAGVSLAILTTFTFASYQVFKNFPAARNAPRIGQSAPEFTLVDSNGKSVSLAQLRASPLSGSGGAIHASRGVLVVFYRGYW